MSPTNKKKLELIRIMLDKLDNELLKLIKKRSNLVNEVLKVKILNKIKKKSIQSNIDPKITNRIWKNMIWSFIDYEKRNFKKK
jgi:chorismate mutase